MTRKPKTASAPPQPVPAPGIGTLLAHRPPWLALGLLAVAALLSQAPDPTGPEATGQSLRVLALPVLVLAVLRVVSQRRALAAGAWRSARVSTVETLTSGEALPRNRILWADGDGRVGRSLVITKPWVPPKGSAIRVVQDPSNGRQWWEGDIPGAPTSDSQTAAAASPAPRAATALSWPATWVALMAGLAALIFGLSDAPLALTALPAIAAAIGAGRSWRQWRSLSRALRHGARIEGKVTQHFAAPVVLVTSSLRQGPRGAAMRWETTRGHFGRTDYVAHDRVIPIGKPIRLRVDPVTGVAVWDENAPPAG